MAMKKYFLLLLLILFISPLAAQETAPSPTTEQARPPQFEKDPFGVEFEKEGDSFKGKFMQMLFLLGLIIAFMLLASYMLKRLNKSRIEQHNQSSLIQIREARVISARSTIYVLDVQGKGLVIAESPTGVTHLTTIALDDEHDR